MRWKSVIGGLAAMLAVVAGCKQQCFITEADFTHYQNLMPANLEGDPAAIAHPTIELTPKPATTLDPERPMRYLPLAEAIALALEQGNIGNQGAVLGSGSQTLLTQAVTTFGDTPAQFTTTVGGRVGGADSVRVFALDPAIIGAGIESSLSKFDAVWNSSVNWTTTDRPIGTSLDVFQAGNSGLSAIVQEDATVSTGILKPLPTGGVAGITFSTAYTLTNLPAQVNPAYRPTLQFAFEQPLLQGFGVEINQIRPTHPGSVLTPGILNTQPTQEGILVTRIRFDQQRAEFERLVQTMLANVETAYWNLYTAYWVLYSQEQGMRQAFEAWKINSARYAAGRVSIADLAQTRGQYEQFREQRIRALNDLLESERELRGLLGLPTEDGSRLVPTDTPTLAPFRPDWDISLAEALNLRPELYLVRQEVKANQLNVILQKNGLMPDLRFTGTYDINDIGSRLDGPDANNALRNLASDHFNNWAIGLRLVVPIGYRNAYANLRIAKLQLARSYATLQDSERKVSFNLDAQYRRLETAYEQVRALRAQREAFADQLRARFQEFLAGRGTLDILLEAQRFWAAALSQEYVAIRDYNNAIVAFELAKGTIMQHDNVTISEGPLPACVQARAVEHVRERSKALVVREHALPPVGPGPAEAVGPAPLPKATAAPVPAMLNDAGKLPETLPEPTPIMKPAPEASRPADLPAAAVLPPQAAPVGSLGSPNPLTLPAPPPVTGGGPGGK